MHDDARTNIAIALTAAEKGAAVANYCEVTSLLKDSGGRAEGVAVLDRGAPGLDVAADLAAAAAVFAALRPGLPFLDDPPTAAVPPHPSKSDDDDDDGLDGLDEVLAGLSGGASPEG